MELSQIGFEKLSLKILKSLDFIDFFSKCLHYQLRYTIWYT